MAEREQFSFSKLGVTSTEEIDGVGAGEVFLSSDPEDITFVQPRTKVEQEESKEKKQEVKKTIKKPLLKEEETEEEETPPSKEIEDREFFDVLEEEAEEEPVEGGKKPPKKELQSDDDSDNEESENNVYSTVTKELLNHSIFTLDEGEEDIEIDSPEGLLERFQYESRKQASLVIDKFLSRYGDDYRDMFDNIFVKGVKPTEYLNRYTKIQSVKDLDLTDEANQERIVRELYRVEGRSAEYIEKKINQLKNYNDLLDESTEAQKILLDREEKEIEESAKKKQDEIQRKETVRAEYINNVGRILSDKLKSKEFDGIPVDKKFADQIYGYLTQERFQTPDGELLTTFDKDVLDLKRPENHELRVKVAMLLQLLREDPQLTKLAKKAVSKESNELFKGLKKTAMKTGKKTEIDEEPKLKSWFQ